MFDIGFSELVLIGVIALIVIGPERLPEVARTVGKYVGRMRRFVNKVRDDIDREIRQEEIRDALKRNADINEIKNIIDDTRYTIEDEVQEAKQHVVEARDDDPRGDFSQKDMLAEQEDDFENESYGLTDHRDYAEEEASVSADESPQSETQPQTTKTAKSDGGRNEKSNS
jgi:sec-independent protein translocase protein TatB